METHKFGFFTAMFLIITLSYSQVQFDLAQEIKADFVQGFSSIIPADLDGDGDLDVVLGHQIFLNQGNGSLKESKGALFSSTHSRGSSSLGDIDGDGDIDIFVKPEGIVFINNGSAGFTLQDSPMKAAQFESIWAGELVDIDYDGDIDCFMYRGGKPEVYLNDGNGNFEIIENSIFPITSSGYWLRIYVEDINSDGKQDVIVNAQVNSNSRILKIFINNSELSYTEIEIDSPLIRGSIKVGDLDNDGDNDLIMSGDNATNQGQTDILINDGSLNFTRIEHTIAGFKEGSIELIDVDSDNDLDIILTGISGPREKTALYYNEGNLVFTEVLNQFEQLKNFSSTVTGIGKMDLDFDGDHDVIITGTTNQGIARSYLYLNNEDDTFTKVGTSPFPDLQKGKSAHGDLNNDGWEDVIIMGSNDMGQTTTQVFINDQNGGFSYNQNLWPVDLGDIEIADFDNDGDKDVIISGENTVGQLSTTLYFNDGTGSFDLFSLDQSFAKLRSSSIAVLDIDNDQDYDIIMIGTISNFTPRTYVYENNGLGEFSPIESGIANFWRGDIKSGDLNNDGSLDLIITGSNDNNDRMTKIYFNNGNGQFEESENDLIGVEQGFISIGDTDSDGDLDFFISGKILSTFELPINVFTFYYINNGDGTFSRHFTNNGNYNSTRPIDLELASSELVDVDNDGDLDFIIAGRRETQFCGCEKMKVYLNDGFGRFYEANTAIEGIYWGSLSSFDFDNDGLVDFLLSGRDDFNASRTRLYKNISVLENLPSVQNPIGNQVINKGFNSVSIDLSDVFLDKSGNGLVYSGSTSETEVVTGGFSGNSLILNEGSKIGESRLVVTAQDENGSIVSDSFIFRVNSIPTVTNSIPNKVYTEGFVSATIDVSNVFSDADGDELDISATVADESIITASYDNGILTINEAITTGQTTVSISASDGVGGMASRNFTVRVDRILSIEPENSLQVYPNPSTNIFTITVPDSSNSNITLKTIDGKDIDYTVIKEDRKLALQLNEEYIGVLILIVEIGDIVYTTKLMKH